MPSLSFQSLLLDRSRCGKILRLDGDIKYIDNPVVTFDLGEAPFRLDYWTLLYCRAGSLIGNLDLSPVEVGSASLVLIHPRRIIEVQKISEDFKGTILLFSDAFVDSLHFVDSLVPTFSLSTLPHRVLESDAEAMFASYCYALENLLGRDSFTYRQEVARLLTKSLVLSLASVSEAEAREADTSRKALLVNDFLRLVSRHYREHRSLQFYADTLCLTPKYITTTLRSQTGRSGAEWIERYVILDAEAMLTSTNLTIQQIADELKFPSQSFFGKYFKRVTGLSPKEYRRAALNCKL